MSSLLFNSTGKTVVVELPENVGPPLVYKLTGGKHDGYYFEDMPRAVILNVDRRGNTDTFRSSTQTLGGNLYFTFFGKERAIIIAKGLVFAETGENDEDYLSFVNWVADCKLNGPHPAYLSLDIDGENLNCYLLNGSITTSQKYAESGAIIYNFELTFIQSDISAP